MSPATFNFLVSFVENEITGDVYFTNKPNVGDDILTACIAGYIQYCKQELES